MMKSGLSPILTINKPLQLGGASKVSDLFNDLVIPNWALSYSMKGGEYKDDISDSEQSDDDIDDDLHDKLLGLAKEQEPIIRTKKKKTRRHKLVKKSATKKRKMI